MNVIDIETYNDDDYVVPYALCYSLDNVVYNEYKTNSNLNIIKKMIDDVFNRKKKKIIFFVHNIEFDGRLILDSLSKTDYILKSNIKNNYIYSILIIKNNNEIFIKCSYKLFPVSLKKIAIDLNIDSKMVFPYKFVNKDNLFYNGETPNMEYFNDENDYNMYIKTYGNNFNMMKYTTDYCRNDVLITIKFLKIFSSMLEKYDIIITNKKNLSLSSLSLNIFKEKYNQKKISFKMNKYDHIIRKSFYGGRCEVFGNIDQSIDKFTYHFDFSGMYGMCMKEKFCYGDYRIEYENFDITKPGFYDLEIESNDMKIPVLPHHSSYSHKLMFTNGVFRSVYWFEEILYFIRQGGKIKKIFSAIVYEKYDYIFTDFVDEFEKFRKLGGSYKTFGKLIINSLYGRLAMTNNYEKTEIINKMNYQNFVENKNMISSSFFNNICIVTYETKKYENVESNISIASAIASKARIKLHKALMSVEENGGSIKYSDTDSIFASFSKNVDNMKHGEVYWDMSKQDTSILDAVFISPKAYAIKYSNNTIKIKIKGIHNNNNISLTELKKKFYNNEIIKFNNQLYFTKSISINQKYTSKNIDLNKYNKRYWDENKIKTYPYYYNYINKTYMQT